MSHTLMARLPRLLTLLTFLWLSTSVQAQSPGEPLRVTATVPELGSLARQVGGDQVTVVVFAKGTEDPHFIEASSLSERN